MLLLSTAFLIKVFQQINDKDVYIHPYPLILFEFYRSCFFDVLGELRRSDSKNCIVVFLVLYTKI